MAWFHARGEFCGLPRDKAIQTSNSDSGQVVLSEIAALVTFAELTCAEGATFRSLIQPFLRSASQDNKLQEGAHCRGHLLLNTLLTTSVDHACVDRTD